MTLIRHLCFLALVVLGSLGAIRGPDNFEPDSVWRPPIGTVLWSNGGVLPPTLVPLSFAQGAGAIAQCESGGDVDKVGDAGELGRLQIHVRLHGARMRALGLDPMNESDRIRMAVVLFEERGGTFQAWSCGRMP